MTQQPQNQPRPSDLQQTLQRRMTPLYLPFALVFLALAVMGLTGEEPATTSYAFLALGAAFMLMSTQRYWKRPAAAQDDSGNPDVTPR
jgi:hypothetical protein